MIRAKPMAPDERRASLIAAARPLLVERGLDFTTRQVAEAAGVAEGTIFRAFPTIADLQRAVIADVFDPRDAIAALDAIDPATDLTDRVTAIVAVLQDYASRAHAIFGILHHYELPRDDEHEACAKRQRIADNHARITAAVERVLGPDAHSLTLTPSAFAAMCRSLAFASHHPAFNTTHPADPAVLAHVLVHGARKDHA